MKSSTATAIAIAAVVTIGAASGAYLASRTYRTPVELIVDRRDRQRSYNPIRPVDTIPERSGLAVEDDQIVITSYDEWVRFAPIAIEDALIDGAVGAQGVLVDVMRRALPRYRWPPDPGSPLEQQWPKMVEIVAEKLRLGLDPDPNTGATRRLRLL